MTDANETYVAAEPDQIEAFKDQLGKLHTTRDDAINANFAADCKAAWRVIFNLPHLEDAPMGLCQLAMAEFIQRNPEMVRVMLGDREAT